MGAHMRMCESGRGRDSDDPRIDKVQTHIQCQLALADNDVPAHELGEEAGHKLLCLGEGGWGQGRTDECVREEGRGLSTKCSSTSSSTMNVCVEKESSSDSSCALSPLVFITLGAICCEAVSGEHRAH